MIVNVNSIVQHVNVNVIVKNIVRANNISWNPSTCICQKVSYLKGIFDNLIIVSDEIINAINTMLDSKKVKYKMDCYVFHMFSLVTILPFIIAIICYHYAHGSKQKNIGTLTKLISKSWY